MTLRGVRKEEPPRDLRRPRGVGDGCRGTRARSWTSRFRPAGRSSRTRDRRTPRLGRGAASLALRVRGSPTGRRCRARKAAARGQSAGNALPRRAGRRPPPDARVGSAVSASSIRQSGQASGRTPYTGRDRTRSRRAARRSEPRVRLPHPGRAFASAEAAARAERASLAQNRWARRPSSATSPTAGRGACASGRRSTRAGLARSCRHCGRRDGKGLWIAEETGAGAAGRDDPPRRRGVGHAGHAARRGSLALPAPGAALGSREDLSRRDRVPRRRLGAAARDQLGRARDVPICGAWFLRAGTRGVASARGVEGAGRRRADVRARQRARSSTRTATTSARPRAARPTAAPRPSTRSPTAPSAETQGEIATWQGRPIDALYTATCGGHTEDAKEIFPEQAAPYLDRRARAGPRQQALARTRRVLTGAAPLAVATEYGEDVTRDAWMLDASGVFGHELAGARSPRRSDKPVEARRPCARGPRRWRGSPGRAAPEALPIEPSTLPKAALALAHDLGWTERTRSPADGRRSRRRACATRRRRRFRRAERRALTYLVQQGVLPSCPRRALAARPRALRRDDRRRARLGSARPTRSSTSTRRPSCRRRRARCRWCAGRGARRCRGAAPAAVHRGGSAKPFPSATCSSGRATASAITSIARGASICSSSVRPPRGCRTIAPRRSTPGRSARPRRELEEAVNKRVSVGTLPRPARREARRLGAHRRARGRRLDGEHGREGLRRAQPARPAREPHGHRASARRFGQDQLGGFRGKGWGHGVGLCQVGAYGMAMRGSDYKEILAHYYPGTAARQRTSPDGLRPLACRDRVLYSTSQGTEREEFPYAWVEGCSRIGRDLDRRDDRASGSPMRRPGSRISTDDRWSALTLKAGHRSRWRRLLLRRAVARVASMMREEALHRLRPPDRAGHAVLPRSSPRDGDTPRGPDAHPAARRPEDAPLAADPTRPPILVIAGPTGTGKSRARRRGRGALARRGRRLRRAPGLPRASTPATAKPTRSERERVPHWLIDVADPRRDYSLADYVRDADAAIAAILAARPCPIVVGGTGMYLRGLLKGIVAAPLPMRSSRPACDA